MSYQGSPLARSGNLADRVAGWNMIRQEQAALRQNAFGARQGAYSIGGGTGGFYNPGIGSYNNGFGGFNGSYAGGNSSNRTAYQPSLLDRVGTNGRAGYMGNIPGWAGMIAGIAGVGGYVADILGGVMYNFGGPSPRASQYETLNQTPAYGRTDVFNPHQGSYYGGVNGGYYGGGNGNPMMTNIAMRSPAGVQYASMQAPGFSTQIPPQPVVTPLGIHKYRDNEKFTQIYNLVQQFNQGGEERAKIVADANGNAVIVFKDSDADIDFTFKHGAELKQYIGTPQTSTSTNQQDTQQLNQELRLMLNDNNLSPESKSYVARLQGFVEAGGAIGRHRQNTQPILKQYLERGNINDAEKEKVIKALKAANVPLNALTAGITDVALNTKINNWYNNTSTQSTTTTTEDESSPTNPDN